MVVWAIGDVHGRADLLGPLTEAIRADLRASDAAQKMVVFLGDYVDRGPGSRAVLKYLAALPADEGVQWRFLKGNHEETMVNFLDDPSVGAQWCEYGGEATLRAYGLRPPSLRHRAEGWRHLSSELDHKLDEDERRFLLSLELSVTAGDYFLVHAGARPGEPLADQSEEDLMWIRGEFLRSEVEFEKVVVHGHTPTAEVHADRRRIGIDTKAYASGVLTGLRLEGRDRRILQAVAPRTPTADDGPAAGISLRWADLPAFADLRVADA